MAESSLTNNLRYFLNQIGEFRQVFCNKQNWQGDCQKIVLGKKAIAVQYLRLEVPENELELAASIFEATLNELGRRACFLGFLNVI